MSATLATGSASNGRAKEAAGTPFDDLFDGVDDLIKRVADVENPEIRKIRARVHASMVAAKGVTGVTAANGTNGAHGANGANGKGGANGVAAANGSAGPAERVRVVQIADHADDYLDGYFRDYPAQALGVALLVGLGVGLIVSSRQ
jgi:ElaB/YqjD/DUF883 family membrane-anchored ribosome-binding protein